MKPALPFLLILCCTLTGCERVALARQHEEPLQAGPAPSAAVEQPPTATAPPSPLQLPTAIPTITPTRLPTPTPTPTWVFRPAGRLDAPILLYHHVGVPEKASAYYVSPAAFRRQMELLVEWGYTPIPISLLVEALTQGADIPARPVVITFDDGYRDVYEHAFPVMQELGFAGVLYLVSQHVFGGGFMRPQEIQAMIAAGWEIGNHSATHRDLTRGYSAGLVQAEIVQSQLDLEELLGVRVATFSYPYGAASKALKQQLQDLGYTAAVGVGATWRHRVESIYFLGRSEVRGDFTLEDFAGLLPWVEAERRSR